nr:MAG TPA: hypothetical protein [Microviridae sp.]
MTSFLSIYQQKDRKSLSCVYILDYNTADDTPLIINHIAEVHCVKIF